MRSESDISRRGIPELDTLSRRFQQFAENECHDASPLYERLCLGITADAEILRLAIYARKGQPVPNLLLGAVQYLLLKGVQHPLASFYPSISGLPSVPSNWTEDPYPYFRAFCLERREEIQQLISTRLVQTNEVRRCACLLPAFGIVSERAKGLPLSLIEIGASAGLNLLWDRYGYDYGDYGRYGDRNALVQLACELRGEHHPIIPAVFPQVAYRVGIDLNPIDVRDPDATLWLRALIWPEHEKRVRLLQNAIAVAQQYPPTLLAGDALDLLPEVISAVPPDTALCIFHTFVINQFSPPARERLAALFAEHAQKRDLCVISIAWLAGGLPRLELVSYEQGVKTEQVLAYCSGHARWMEWQ